MIVNRADVERLSDLACQIDDLKNFFDEAQRQVLARVVDDLHQVAVEADAAHGFGFYAGGQG
ncbi:MAG: hypothetical protein ACM3VY_00525 [Candidatus Bathyarchaeota archaeon]